MIVIILAALIVVGAIAIFLTETEKFGWATVTLIGTAILCQVLHVADILSFVVHHGVLSLLYVLGYLVVGVIWSFVKWFSFLLWFRDKYRELKSSFYEKNSLSPDQTIPESLREAWDRHLRVTYYSHRYRGVSLTQKPKASDNKGRIIAWMAFWPLSAVGTVLNDPVKRLFKLLFNTFKALYQKMADRIFANETELQ